MSVEMQQAYVEDSSDTVYLADEAIENADTTEDIVLETETIEEINDEAGDTK